VLIAGRRSGTLKFAGPCAGTHHVELTARNVLPPMDLDEVRAEVLGHFFPAVFAIAVRGDATHMRGVRKVKP
jgi:hypothetical protein